jgi:hypothetical protein
VVPQGAVVSAVVGAVVSAVVGGERFILEWRELVCPDGAAGVMARGWWQQAIQVRRLLIDSIYSLDQVSVGY